jgi:preprotein translocase subunit YajC
MKKEQQKHRLKVGDSVVLNSGGSEGKILGVSSDNNYIFVQWGGTTLIPSICVQKA